MSENKTLLKKLFDRIHMTKMEKNFINVKKLLLKLKMDFYLQYIGYQMTDHQYYCNMVYWKMFKIYHASRANTELDGQSLVRQSTLLSENICWVNHIEGRALTSKYP